MLKHHRQERHSSCGAAAFKIMLSDTVDITEKVARKECHTKASGTHNFNVLNALRARNLDANMVQLDVEFAEYSRWLFLNSMGRKLYLCCHFIDKACGGRGGRDRNRHHAVVCSDGYIYDPGEDKPCPIEAYFDTFSKKLFIKSMIMVDKS